MRAATLALLLAGCSLDGLPDRDTHWTLDGAHLAVPCRDCHTNPDDVLDLPAACAGCHAAPAAHPGGACDGCHNSAGWAPP